MELTPVVVGAGGNGLTAYDGFNGGTSSYDGPYKVQGGAQGWRVLMVELVDLDQVQQAWQKSRISYELSRYNGGTGLGAGNYPQGGGGGAGGWWRKCKSSIKRCWWRWFT